MYILVNRSAIAGEYIQHVETGRIECASWVNNDGSVVVNELFSLETYDFDLEEWNFGEYVVLEQIANRYFNPLE
ncbi:hypothetical protein [Salinibacillus xinjiangensis]|uniref:Uncharacterized protein n=1 Tax=Salinibacillus xinjiangensis TaxID=1229268 RepID=A0A6G1X6Y8_9BACI|nr:hypothetical protein [Salinibacillus xinjiangensis]MRG86702.1 hypothetical protein [Salinibacillus xinjiangensis]